MAVNVTVAHSDFEKFRAFSIEKGFSYDYLGYSDDGKYVRIYGLPSTIFDIIDSHIKITM